MKKIAFAGGGSAGPVTPLLAVLDQLKKDENLEFVWFGTRKGPEHDLVLPKQIPYKNIIAVKLDRFFSLRNFIMPFLFVAAFIQSFKLLRQERPDMVLAAGSFVAVPLVWAAYFMRIPSLIHQLDVRPTLSNKLLAPLVKTITVTFKKSLKDFPKKKALWTGSPVEERMLNPKTFEWRLKTKKPVVFIFGGGGGAMGINELVWNSLEELTEAAEIIHVSGKNKGSKIKHEGYHKYEFLRAKMGDAYRVADLVITRGGIGTIMELAALKKPAIVIPIPHSHQLDNTEMLEKAHAALVLNEKKLSPQIFSEHVIKLLNNNEQMQTYSENIAQFYKPDAISLIVEEIKKILYSQR